MTARMLISLRNKQNVNHAAHELKNVNWVIPENIHTQPRTASMF